MTDDNGLALISAAADGALNDDEQLKLERLLESSAEAREFKAELEQMDSLFGEIRDLEPPEWLHAQILASATTRPARSRSPISQLVGQLQFGAGLRYALAAAAGALLVAIIFQSQSSFPDSGDVSNLVGTIAPSSESADTGVIDGFTFRENGLESTAQLERSGDKLLLNIQFNADSPLDISVYMAGAGVRPDVIALIESDFDSIALNDQTLGIRAVGEQQLTLLLRRVDDAALTNEALITLEYSSGSKLLKREALRPDW